MKETDHIEVIRIQNDVGLLCSNSGSQKTVEQAFRISWKRKSSKNFIPSQTIEQYNGSMKVFSTVQGLLEFTSDTTFLKNCYRMSYNKTRD